MEMKLEGGGIEGPRRSVIVPESVAPATWPRPTGISRLNQRGEYYNYGFLEFLESVWPVPFSDLVLAKFPRFFITNRPALKERKENSTLRLQRSAHANPLKL